METGPSQKLRRTDEGRVQGGDMPWEKLVKDSNHPGDLRMYSEFFVHVNIDKIETYKFALRPVDPASDRVQEMKTIFYGGGYGSTEQYIAVTYIDLPKPSVEALNRVVSLLPDDDKGFLTALEDLPTAAKKYIAK